MNTSSRVDVVVAEGQPTAVADEHADIVTEPVETADVAPDPSRRTIVLAMTKQDGREAAEVLGIEPVAILTPRTPDAARGIPAEQVVEAPGLADDVRLMLTDRARPSLSTAGE